jgi:hypothetical protein
MYPDFVIVLSHLLDDECEICTSSFSFRLRKIVFSSRVFDFRPSTSISGIATTMWYTPNSPSIFSRNSFQARCFGTDHSLHSFRSQILEEVTQPRAFTRDEWLQLTGKHNCLIDEARRLEQHSGMALARRQHGQPTFWTMFACIKSRLKGYCGPVGGFPTSSSFTFIIRRSYGRTRRDGRRELVSM